MGILYDMMGYIYTTLYNQLDMILGLSDNV